MSPPTGDRQIAAEVVGDRIQIIDHRECKGCDCPALLDLTWKETTQLRLQVHRAISKLGEQIRHRNHEQGYQFAGPDEERSS